MTRRRANWRISRALVAARPRLSGSAVVGLIVGTVCLAALHMRLSTGLILGWDSFCGLFLLLTTAMVWSQTPEQIARRAATQDEGQGVILLLIVSASAASLAAVAAELTYVKEAQALTKALHVALAVATVAGSWLTMQAIMALHYAHEYYAADDSGEPCGGLSFPGNEAPDYWDFLHFAIIIGVASQTADIAITQHQMRRLGTVHSLIAFVFNTLIIALTINLVAGLF